ncbi:MAG: GspE/PulE family protein, partial [Gammaproteobacteria bacterium]|nr:GspE/PulE family protein [Gammaproteobacteria bacterium]
GDAAAMREVLKHSKGHAEELRDITENFKPLLVKENDSGEETILLDEQSEAGPVIRFVNALLKAALQKRASDIHIEAYENGIVVKNRIDGVLYPATEVLDSQYHSALVSRLKVMAELDIAEKRVPQDGRFRLRIGGKDIDFRVSVLPSIYGEDIVIRILDKSSLDDGIKNLSLDNLGFAPDVLQKFRKSIREPYGMVLITGPTGSGKTTTLYGALTEFDTSEEKIITIEDPVEYQLEGVVQIPVNEKKDLTFAKGLRSILRHDPDKIMVGEIRDRETVQIAIQSALTGHLVFTTVHANNAFDVIGRFSHMGVDIYSFVSALNCVMAQRLVRRICSQCKTEVTLDEETIRAAGLDPVKYKDQKWFEGKGCHECSGTGYLGRIAISEFLDLSPCIREMIVEKKPLSELYTAAIAEGMVTLRQTALDKVLSGETTLKEANRVTFVD